MKNIFLIISKDVIRRNIYDTGFWQAFLENTKDIQKVLIVPHESVDVTQDTFGGQGVVVESYQKVSWRGWDKFVMFLVRTGIFSHSTLLYRKRAYKRGQAGFFITYVKGFVARTLGNFNWAKRLVRFFVGRLSTSEELRNLYDKYQPEAVFAPSLIDTDFDVPVSIEARRRNIKVVGMVRSWDNLNNHGILPFVPDDFIVQNTWLVEAAKKFQGVTKGINKTIIGLPHYDIYFDPTQYIKSRSEFMENFGLDPNKKFVLLGGSDFYYSEDSLPRLLNQAIIDGEIKQPLQIVFRPHPATMFSKEDYNLDNLKHVFLDDAFSGKQKFSDTEKFVNLMYHADIIINISSTLSIDAAVFDTPAICIKFDDPNRKLSYYEKVDRLYDTFDHYEFLVDTKGVRTSESPAELFSDINDYLSDSTLDKAGRQEIINRFVAPFDGKAGARLSDVVVESIRK